MNGSSNIMENSLRNFLFTIPLVLIVESAWAQDGASVTDNCANRLNTSPNPTVGATLNCLAGMQRTIDELKATMSELSESDVTRIAQKVIDEQPSAPSVLAPIPPGAVLASVARCETLEGNWEPFREATGRFLIGAGNESLRAYRRWQRERPEGGFEGVDLNVYEVLATGGEEEHTLSIPEMPLHDHSTDNLSVGSDQAFMHSNPAYGVTLQQGQHHGGVPHINTGAPTNYRTHSHDLHGSIGSSGRGEAHNNMPPYVALYFCKKR